MQEIKYRGKVDGVWWYVSPDHILSLFQSFWNLADRETIGQYTGLKDKSGKEIYEGDIIQWKGAVASGYPRPTPQEMKWHDALCGFEPFCFYDNDCDGVPNVSDYYAYEIIGNIYENPNLLTTN